MVSKTAPEALPAQTVHYLKDFPYAPSEPFYNTYETGVPIAVDFGSSNIRAGLTNSDTPNNIFPSLVSRYRDRKTLNNLILVGNDVHTDLLLRLLTKSPFDGPMLTNWELAENILDYTFEHLNVAGSGSVDNPILMTELVNCPITQRANMYELLFELYSAPKVAFGIDSLFAYHYSSPANSNGLVISAANEQTHVIPVLNGRGVLLQTKRIDWGANPSQQFLLKALLLKYPYYPSKLNNYHTTNLVKDYCYVLENYLDELKVILDMDVLEHQDVLVQLPVEISATPAKKSEDELARQTAKRREQGKRLQEQAQQKRIEKLAQKQVEWDYYSKLRDEDFPEWGQDRINTKVKSDGFEDLADFNKYLAALEKTLKRANNDEDEEEVVLDPTTAWPLVDTPDDQLTEDLIKEKRKQKLMKGNYEARERNKEVKRQEDELKQKKEAEEQKAREANLENWASLKRIELSNLTDKYKEGTKLIDSFKDRKSVAAQQRMRNIADLANDANGLTNAASRKRRRNANSSIDNDPNDTFGTNDDDWAVYRGITNSSLEEDQEDISTRILELELELLKYDPNFNHEDTFAVAQTFDWKLLQLHKFIHGPRPNIVATLQQQGLDQDELANNPEVIRKNHQMHLNVERIRIPEVLFQPHIAGLDQAGIPELVSDLLHRRLDGNFSPGGQAHSIIQNVIITGGMSNLPNFRSRVVKEFTLFLPVGSKLNVKTTPDATIDPWRGMKKWSEDEEAKKSYVSKKEYQEYGLEYIKEHGLGNVCLM